MVHRLVGNWDDCPFNLGRIMLNGIFDYMPGANTVS